MSRFVIEHLPRTHATYQVIPLDHEQAKAWIERSACESLVRTTELIAAITVGLRLELTQSELSITLRAGDEAMLISLSFGVLLAFAEGGIPPLPEDWRCSLLMVGAPADKVPHMASEAREELADDVLPS